MNQRRCLKFTTKIFSLPAIHEVAKDCVLYRQTGVTPHETNNRKITCLKIEAYAQMQRTSYAQKVGLLKI